MCILQNIWRMVPSSAFFTGNMNSSIFGTKNIHPWSFKRQWFPSFLKGKLLQDWVYRCKSSQQWDLEPKDYCHSTFKEIKSLVYNKNKRILCSSYVQEHCHILVLCLSQISTLGGFEKVLQTVQEELDRKPKEALGDNLWEDCLGLKLFLESLHIAESIEAIQNAVAWDQFRDTELITMDVWNLSTIIVVQTRFFWGSVWFELTSAPPKLTELCVWWIYSRLDLMITLCFNFFTENG